MRIAKQGQRVVESREPADPDRLIGRFPLVGEATLDRAIGAADAAQAEWAAVAPARAAALMGWAAAVEAQAEDLALLVAREVGKPIREARGEVARTAAILRYYSQAAFDPVGETYPSPDGRATLSVERLPLGVVVTICPWNFPLAIPAWKIAPALAYGNAVLFKPSSAALATAHRLVELGAPHLPAGVLALVPLESPLAERLTDDPRVDGVSFTGSVGVGRSLVARVAARGVSVQAEMGGQNPSLVLADADLERAAAMIAEAAMSYAGQKCTATSRVVVERTVAERFVPLLVDHVRALAVGEPTDEATAVGPLISAAARESTCRAVEAALARGGRRLAGAEAPNRPGYFYAPTLVALDEPADPFAQEETFGPAASVLVVDSEDDAVRVANGTPYGLSAAVFGSDVERALRVARRIEAGLVRVNASTAGVDYYAPFGGEKASSYGPREQGRAAREFYTRTRTVLAVSWR